MRSKWLFYLLFTLLLPACKNSKVISFNNPELINRDYLSYKFVTEEPDSLLFDERSVLRELHDGIEAQMALRDLTSVSENSDLLLRYKLFSNRNVSQVAYRRNDGSIFRNRTFANPNFIDFSYRNLTESILLIDIFDIKREKLVWQGSLDLNVPAYKNKRGKELIKDAVVEIFDSFQYKNNEQ